MRSKDYEIFKQTVGQQLTLANYYLKILQFFKQGAVLENIGSLRMG